MIALASGFLIAMSVGAALGWCAGYRLGEGDGFSKGFAEGTHTEMLVDRQRQAHLDAMAEDLLETLEPYREGHHR